MLPILHLWIRDLTDYERLGQFLYARNAFPNKIPIMHGRGFPARYRKRIKKRIAEGKQFMQDQARNGPLGMMLMTPDAHGTGGSRLESSINQAHI